MLGDLRLDFIDGDAALVGAQHVGQHLLDKGEVQRSAGHHRISGYAVERSFQFANRVGQPAGKDSTQEEFFHTMNEIITAGRRLVITSDRAPQDLDGIAPRILSRLSWGLVADINPADYELRLNIIDAKLAALPGIDMPRGVVEFLARRISSSIRELEGALNRIAAYAMMTGRAIDVPFVEEVLANVLRANQRRISIDEIQTQVAEHYRIRKAEMTSARRAREVARPRQVAMYLSKQLTPKSLPDIGRRFGGRDHTTVIHAVKQIERLRAADSELDADIRLLTRQLEG